MRCYNCNNLISGNTDICSYCGVKIEMNLIATKNFLRGDSLLFVIYVGWVFVTNILFIVVNKFVVPRIISTGPGYRVGILFKGLNFIISGIDIFLIALILYFAKSKLVKRAFIVFLTVRIAMFILSRLW